MANLSAAMGMRQQTLRAPLPLPLLQRELPHQGLKSNHLMPLPLRTKTPHHPFHLLYRPSGEQLLWEGSQALPQTNFEIPVTTPAAPVVAEQSNLTQSTETCITRL